MNEFLRIVSAFAKPDLDDDARRKVKDAPGPYWKPEAAYSCFSFSSCP
jgi:hypothetical protein